MGRPSIKLDIKQLKRINERVKKLTIEELKGKLVLHSNKSRGVQIPLEQIVIVLKLIHLSGVNLNEGCRLIGMSKPTLLKWRERIGPIVYLAEPESQIAEKVENDIIKIKGEAVEESFKLINKGLRKLSAIVETTSTPRHIYVVSEAVKTGAEVLRTIAEMEKLNKDPEQPGATVNNFFTETMNMMIKNANNGNENQPAGDIQKRIEG
jgi:hypothetical protein